MCMKRRLLATGLLALGLLGLAGCKDKEKEPEWPETYQLGELSVEALSQEEESVCQASGEEEVPVVYSYEGFAAPGLKIGDYAAQLVKENGFVQVDEECRELLQEPDYTATDGVVRLARDNPSGGSILSMEFTWSGQSCTVTLCGMEAEAIGAPVGSNGMTLFEAEDMIYTLHPEVLGLEGNTMRDYHVYIMNGSVRVNGRSCLRFKVYTTENVEQTNDFLGFYFLTGDGMHLYRYDRENESVTELY